MSFNDQKFTPAEIAGNSLSYMPDKPTEAGYTAAQLKEAFGYALRVKELMENFNGLIEALQASTAAAELGASVSSVTTKTVQAILSSFETAIANRYTKAETEALTGQETNSLVADVDVNLTTGVITVTKKDGTSETFDTAMEKVPATFELVNSSGAVYLKITNVDGTSTQTDITSLMNVYTHANSDDIAWTETGTGNVKTVTAFIRANSIGLDKLSLSAISTLEGYVSSAADSATAAASSASSAQQSAASAQASKGEAATSEAGAIAAANDAQGSAEEAATAETNAKAAATTASTRAADSEAWAVGTRNGEAVGSSDPAYQNNAKYYKERAAEIAGGDFIPTTEKGAENGVATLDANGKLTDTQKPGYTASEVGAAAATHASQHASGGSDPITPADIGALPLSGGTMTGDVYFSSGLARLSSSDTHIQLDTLNTANDFNNRRLLYLRSANGADLPNAVFLSDVVDGARINYPIYGKHNQPWHSLASTETTPSNNYDITWTYE